MRFFLGCAVWAYKDWVGTFYPPKTPSKDFLRCYGDRFLTVEGNTTFYSVPDLETIQRWQQDMPLGFQFFPKFPQTVSHQGFLAPQIPLAQQFIERMVALGDRLGGIFLQLPPSYSPLQLTDLDNFLQQIKGNSLRIAVEVRHRDWFQDKARRELNHCLRSHDVARVLLDSRPIYAFEDDPQVQSPRKKPQLPLHLDLTANFSLIRLITHPYPPNNETFLNEWVTQIQQWQTQDLDLFFYVHCPDERRSPFTALNLQERLQEAKTDVPALPWQKLPPAPEQLSLF